MSLLGNLFGKSLESGIADEFIAYKDQVDQLIERENAVLRSLGIPPPRQTAEISYKQTPGNRDGRIMVRLISPQFELPPFRQFVIRYKLVATVYENLEELEASYLWFGFASVLSCPAYHFVWTNREPFEFYQQLQKKPDEDICCDRAGDLTASAQAAEKSIYSSPQFPPATAKKLPALQAVTGLSVEEAANVHLRVETFNYAVNNEIGPLTDPANYYNPFYAAATHIPDHIMLGLPVPQTWMTQDYSAIKILPSGAIKPGQMIEFLSSLRPVNRFISFELLGQGESVYFRLQLPTKSAAHIVSKLKLFFPDFEMIADDTAAPVISQHSNWLQKHSMYHAIKCLRDFQLDPYAHFAELFETTEEPLCYQIMFAPLPDEAAAVLKGYLFDAPSHLPDFHPHFVKRLPLWFVGICVSSTNKKPARLLARAVAATLDATDRCFDDPYYHPIANVNFPLLFPNYLSLCDADELAALAHFPVTDLPLERLEQLSMKNVAPPPLYTTGTARIGEHRGRDGQMLPVTLPDEVRDRHLYLVGKSGTGKSTLIETIARRDIADGGGVAVIDPHGDLISRLLETMPEERVSDCILFSPKQCPVSLEILTAENEHEIDLLSDDLITMFRRTSESWGDKMQAILQMAFQTLLRVPGSSFTDITPLLTDESYRRRILDKIDHPQLATFWENRYDVRQAEPILIRMDRLTTSGTLRKVLTQTKNSLNFYDVIAESKILLADLSKGFLGESTSHLLGSIIVSQIQLAAMRQGQLPAEQRIPFSLFVDEVQNFTTSAFTTILSEARKQKLRLTIAHQFVSQLPGDIQKAVFGNVGTLVFFALSPDDLGAARHELGSFEAADVANLPKYHALCRPVTAARDTFSFSTDPPATPPSSNYTQMIIEQTRREYGSVGDSGEAASPPPIVNAQTPPAANLSQTVASAAGMPPVIVLDRRRPAPAQPLVFATNTEKILHYLRQAEYLSQPQIIALTDLQASNASTALKKLVETGQIKSLDDRRPKIYFIGRTCNPTTHNLLVRDLFVKISQSKFAARAIKFNENLPDLNPDLAVEFVVREENSLSILPVYFELDRGTEGVTELVRKADRYALLEGGSPRVCFIFERESDLALARKTIHYPFISYAVLDQFTTLHDEAFGTAGGDHSAAPASDIKLPFFR